MSTQSRQAPYANEALQAIRQSVRDSHPLTVDEEELRRRQEQTAAFGPRNGLLLALAMAVGATKMHTGALKQTHDGVPPSRHYRDAEHIQYLIRTEQERTQFMGQLACDICPVAGNCGIGSAELAQELRDPTTRRRFVARLRRRANAEFCERNLDPARLVHTKIL